jgi:hypothetical protein
VCRQENLKLNGSYVLSDTVAPSNNIDRSSDEAVEFDDPSSRQVLRTAAPRAPKAHEIAKHVEASDSDAICSSSRVAH